MALESDSRAARSATPGTGGPGRVVLLAIAYPILLLVSSGLAFVSSIGLGSIGQPGAGSGVWVSSWAEWMIPLFAAVFSCLLTLLLSRWVGDRSAWAWAVIWGWSLLVFAAAGVLAFFGSHTVVDLVTDTPGGFWALALGGLVGFLLGGRANKRPV